MKFNFITPMTKADALYAKENTEKYGVKIVDTRRTTREINVWGQLEDLYVFICKGTFEDMIRLKNGTEKKFKMYNGVSLV